MLAVRTVAPRCCTAVSLHCWRRRCNPHASFQPVGEASATDLHGTKALLALLVPYWPLARLGHIFIRSA